MELTPDHTGYIMRQNILFLISSVVFCFAIFIFYKAPKSRESVCYKCLTGLQFVSMYLLAFTFSLMSKFWSEPNSYYYYCEGYFNILNIRCGMGYIIVLFFLGLYVSALTTSYLYRYHLITESSHIFKRLRVCEVLSFVIFCIFTIVPPYLFYSVPSDPNFSILNISDSYEKYLKERSVTAIPSNSIEIYIYVFYSLVSFTFAILTKTLMAYFITVKIKEKQNIIGPTSVQYHKKLLINLIIQSSVTSFGLVVFPAPLYLSLFIPINNSLLELSYLAMPSVFLINTCLYLTLNKTASNTIKALWEAQKNYVEFVSRQYT